MESPYKDSRPDCVCVCVCVCVNARAQIQTKQILSLSSNRFLLEQLAVQTQVMGFS